MDTVVNLILVFSSLMPLHVAKAAEPIQPKCKLGYSLVQPLRREIRNSGASCKNQKLLAKIAWVESRGGRNLKNSKSTASNPYQYLDSTFKAHCPRLKKNNSRDATKCALKDIRKGRKYSNWRWLK